MNLLSAATMGSAVTDIMSVVTTMMTTITGNSVLFAFFVAPIIAVAIAIVKKLRS